MYDVRFVAEHYSPVCRATIPARWTCRYIGDLPDGITIYADGDTREEAVRICQSEFARWAGVLV